MHQKFDILFQRGSGGPASETRRGGSFPDFGVQRGRSALNNRFKNRSEILKKW